MTFKENCPDIRNSRSVDVYNHLTEYGLRVFAADYLADEDEFRSEYGIELMKEENIHDADCLVILVAHEAYCHRTPGELKRFFQKDTDRPLVPVTLAVKRTKLCSEIGGLLLP